MEVSYHFGVVVQYLLVLETDEKSEQKIRTGTTICTYLVFRNSRTRLCGQISSCFTPLRRNQHTVIAIGEAEPRGLLRTVSSCQGMTGKALRFTAITVQSVITFGLKQAGCMHVLILCTCTRPLLSSQTRHDSYFIYVQQLQSTNTYYYIGRFHRHNHLLCTLSHEMCFDDGK